jgi:hypothetical protein
MESLNGNVPDVKQAGSPQTLMALLRYLIRTLAELSPARQYKLSPHFRW